MFTTMATIVGVGLTVLALAILAVCILKSLFRPVFRTGMQLLVAVVCIPIALLLAKIVGVGIKNAIIGAVNVPIVDAILEEIPSSSAAAGALVQVITAPLLFLCFYLLLWIIIGTVVGLIVRAMERGNSKVACYRNRWIGMGIGVVCALVLFVVFLAPLSGLTGMATDIVDRGVLEIEDEDGDPIIDLSRKDREGLDEILNHPVLKVSRTLGGRALFRSLSTANFAGEKLSLTAEINNACDLVMVATPLLNTPMAELDERDVRDIEKQIPVALENSSLLRVLGAEALSGASRAWLRGNDFVTIERPDMGSIGNVAMDAVLELFKDTTPETVVEDVRALTPVLSAAVAVTKLQAGANMEDIVETLAEAATSPEIKGLLVSAGVRILANELNLYENKDAIHEAYATSLADLSTKNLTQQELVDQISALNTRFVIDMTDEDVRALANAIVNMPFDGELEYVPTTALPTSVIILQPCLGAKAPTFEFLAKNPLTTWLAALAANTVSETSTLGWLAESDKIPTSLVTGEDLIAVASQDALADLGKDEMASLITVAAQMLVSEEKPSITDVLTTVGDSLSGVAASDKGKDLVTAIVTGVMQSDTVCETLGITPSQATGLANSLKESGSLENLSQTAADVTKLMNIINQLQSGAGAADKLTAEELHSLISTMNDSTAELLRTMCAPDMLIKMGLPADYAKGVAHLTSDLLEGLIKARKNWSEAAYQKEADALYKILKLAIGAKNSKGNTFEERIGMSAEELIETVQASELMLDVLPDSINELYDETPDALGLSKKISEKDRNHLKEKIDEYKDSANPRGDALLDALARMLG